jgi:phage terminase Nu1 subunit (DNA packaging protein)
MMEWIKNHPDSTAKEVAEATGYTAEQVRSSLRPCHKYNGESFRQLQDHSRKGSPIVYWVGPLKLRGLLQAEMINLLARYEKGIATGRELRKIADLVEIFEGKDEYLKWLRRAAEQGDSVAIRILED